MNRVENLKSLMDNFKVCKIEDVNVFDAVGMSNLETKHSRYLVWLLKPDNKHNFNDTVIKKFLNELVKYNTIGDKKTDKTDSNLQILKNSLGIYVDDRLTKIEQSEIVYQKLVKMIGAKFTVEPEIKIDDMLDTTSEKRRYIDILIKSEDIVITIENKTGSDTHTDQLKAYQRYIDTIYPDLKKIFVFLSPKGQLPYNKGGDGSYNNNWCVFDYREIVQIINKLLFDVKEGKFAYKCNKQKQKMVFLLEDYMEMVNKSLLTINQKWELIRDHSADIVELYQSLQNKKENLEYCRVWLKNNLSSYIEDNVVENSFNFHTQAIEDYFIRHNEQYAYLKSTWFCGSDGGINGVFKTDKKSSAVISLAAKITEYNTNAKKNKQTQLKKTYDIITDNETWLLPLSGIKQSLDENLKNFKQAIELLDNLIEQL